MKKQWLVWPVLLSLCALAYGQDGTPSDLKKMQGKWTPTTLYKDAELLPEEVLSVLAVSFKGGTMTLEVGSLAVAKVEFRLDPSKTPKVYEPVVPDGPDKGKVVPGIYELDGDSLKISVAEVGGARPKNYSVPEGKSGRVVMILRRAK